MKTRWNSPPAFALFAFGALLVVAGCGSNQSPVNDAGHGVVRLLASEYGRFVAARHTPPKDRQQFADFLQSRRDKLKGWGIQSVDELLTSPRDGQPMVVAYGKRGPAPPDHVDWVAYEQTGVSGKRLVADARGGVRKLTEEQFSERVAAKTS